MQSINIQSKDHGSQSRSTFKYGRRAVKRLRLSDGQAVAQLNLYQGIETSSCTFTGRNMTREQHEDLKRAEGQINALCYQGQSGEVQVSSSWGITP